MEILAYEIFEIMRVVETLFMVELQLQMKYLMHAYNALLTWREICFYIHTERARSGGRP